MNSSENYIDFEMLEFISKQTTEKRLKIETLFFKLCDNSHFTHWTSPYGIFCPVI